MVTSLYVRISPDPLFWEEISSYETMYLYDMLKMENAFWTINSKS